ncbi:glutaconate CoA-transferase subunit B [Aurantimicrobium minutum]|uniref:CoA-transferase subunit beta n=1 Tax=Aurantimicrobium minutum TaxID=708131 RepID=UPI00247611A1|nr:CoA-transferase [Aurantimicrobium minutum]MDH6532560.1 glutaconate CoA-transferase subunit B [Aurantimicrobium minutum]
MTTTQSYSVDELITITAARELVDNSVVFAGIGLPTLAVSLAQNTTATNLEVIYESGVCGAHPSELPSTIADAVLITDSEAVLTISALFGYVLQGGRIDVGFLGAAQIDKHGNLNSSVIGDWDAPAKRLPGSGGAHEVLANANETFVIMRRHTARAFVKELDFCTSAGPDRVIAEGGTPRSRGVTKVFTEYGVMSRAGAGEELTLTAIHRGITAEDVVAATGWELQVSPELTVIAPPTEAELALLRDEIDPSGVYLR